MQRCAHCGQENYEGVIFCEKCGVALVPIPLSTRQLLGGEKGAGTDELESDGLLILQIEEHETPITVQFRSEVILGRASEQEEGTTYINLTPYGAEGCGVSKYHARLFRDNKAIYLMDLNSTNGTRLNREILPRSVEQRVRDGDELALGKMKIYIYFNNQT
jgi:hypothetical protein